MQLFYLHFFLIFSLLFSINASAQTILIYHLPSAPAIDGSGTDWSHIPETTVTLTPLVPDSKVEAHQVVIKAGYYKEDIYFYLNWHDSESDTLHKPYVWSEVKNKYIRGPQREDRLALQFDMEGDFNANWLSGQSFTADMWHWKSSRSNPIGLAHDKLAVISTERLLRASKLEGDNGPVYVLRKSDAGDPLYTTKRYRNKEQAIMPKYILNKVPLGSIADISAKGIWADGRWHLELRRKLNTGHSDDAVFLPGQTIKGAIAIFDASENDDHNISGTLLFTMK